MGKWKMKYTGSGKKWKQSKIKKIKLCAVMWLGDWLAMLTSWNFAKLLVETKEQFFTLTINLNSLW